MPKSTSHCDNPLVSAIITTHDRKPGMVLRAVNSVLNQTYQNIELIVVDDSAPSFAQRAEVEHSVRSISESILYIKHECCQGACAARNTGLRHADGLYVGFLDDDDEWLPTKIEEQLKGFEDENIALVYSGILIVDDEKHTEYLWKSQHESGYIFENLLRYNFIGSTSNPLIKKECIKAVGGFDVLMESAQDFDLYLRLALRYPVQYIDTPLLRYHIHPGKRITTDSEGKIKGIERLLSKYADYFSKDREARYRRCCLLLFHYLKVYGRKRAFVLWLTCVKIYPRKVTVYFKQLVMIILGNDLYTTMSKRRAALYHLLGRDRRV